MTIRKTLPKLPRVTNKDRIEPEVQLEEYAKWCAAHDVTTVHLYKDTKLDTFPIITRGIRIEWVDVYDHNYKNAI